MTTTSSSSVSVTVATDELERRGVNNTDRFTSTMPPELIVRTCKDWDLKEGVGPGLLVKMLRDVHANEDATEEKRSKREQLRERFNAVAGNFPPGSVTESHRRLARRCWPGDREDCQGVMVVFAADWPMLMAVCDGCGFEASYPARALGVLPAQPPVPARPIP